MLAPSFYQSLTAPGKGAAGDWFPRDPGGLAALDLADGATTLAAAFGVPAGTVTALLGDLAVMPAAPGGGTDTGGSLEALARIHRHAELARRLRLAPADYLRALRLWDRDPFATPARLQDFVAAVDEAEASPLSVEAHATLCRGEIDAAPETLAQADTALLFGIRAALAAVATESAFIELDAQEEAPTLDPDGAVTAAKLAAIGLPEPLVARAIDALTDSVERRATDPAIPANVDPAAIPLADYRVALAAVPAGVDPAALTGGAVAHAAGELVATRVLSAAERDVLTGADPDAAWRAALVALYALQDRLAGRARYDAATRTLTFTGLMDATWRAHLDAVSADPAWAGVVADLHDRPRRALRQVLKAWRPAPVTQPLPAGLPVTLPPSLAGRLEFDSSVNPAQLRLTGPLLAEEVAALHAAAAGGAADLVAFRNAVTALAQAADAAVPAAADALLDAAAIDAVTAQPVPAAEQFRLLLRVLMPRVRDILTARTLTNLLVESLGLDCPTLDHLAGQALTAGAPAQPVAALLRAPGFVASPMGLVPNATAFPDQHAALRKLRQGVRLAAGLSIRRPDFDLMARFAGWPALNALPGAPVAADAAAPFPAATLARFVDYAAARDRIPGGRETLTAILDAATAPGAGAADIAAATAARTGVEAGEIATLIGPGLLALNLPADILAGTGLFRLTEALDALVRIGIGATAVAGLRNAQMAPEAGRAVTAGIARGMAPGQWREDGRALSDALRVATRDAFLDYLIARGRPAEMGLPARRWRDAAELFGHLLIDVEMGACMETSRLRQAMSSVQLFAQRCQLGQERQVTADVSVDDGWEQWSFMRTYRVWEANRKVFLWPENLLRTEFMDVKSPLLRELEGALGQGEVTIEGAARAMLGYLEGLKKIARMEPLSMAVESRRGRKTHHVVAATRGAPRTLHYRYREDTKIWSPWEPVELEITSDHVLLHVWQSRVFLFWLDFQRIAEDGEMSGSQIVSSQRFEVRLGWSELTDTGWTEQGQSAAVLSLGLADANRMPLDYLFRISEDADGALWVRRRLANSATFLNHDLQGFRIEYPHAEPEVEVTNAYFLPDPALSAVYQRSGQEIARFNGLAYELKLPFDYRGQAAVLRNVRRTLRLAHSSDVSRASYETEAFLAGDRQRSFFVVPSAKFVSGPVWVGPKVNDGIWDLAEPFWEDPRIWPIDPDDPFAPRAPTPGDPPIPDIDPEGGPLVNPVRTFGHMTDRAMQGGAPVKMPAFEGNPYAAAAADMRAEIEGAGTMYATSEKAVARRNAVIGDSILDAIALTGVLPQSPPEARALSLDGEGGQALMMRWGGDAEAGMVFASYGASSKYGWTVEGAKVGGQSLTRWTERSYLFAPFYHAYPDTLIHVLRGRGVETMLSRDVQLRPHAYRPIQPGNALNYRSHYNSVDGRALWHVPTEALDFDYDAAYAVYNWELFYHVPMLIAERLADSQRFDAALRWLHMIFDPTDQSGHVTMSDGTQRAVGIARHWQTKPLFLNSLPGPGGSDSTVHRERIERILTVLAADAAPDRDQRLTPADEQDLERFKNQIEEMRRKPFRPNAIARLRTSAYQRATVMAYVKILIRWGDQLFRRDTIETVNAATQIYLLAASFRGRAGAVMPPRAVAAPQTFASLEPRLDTTGNALVEIEAFVTPSAAPEPLPLPGLAPPAMLAFCVPRNDKLDQMWGEVGDRLFKIRNCQNIDGVKRKLALFEPPIDPELLARAIAARLDIDAALAMTGGAAPRHRFRFLIGQAEALAEEVRRLGAALLSALERKDAEELSQLRQRHQVQMYERAEALRELQLEEAEANLETLRARRLVALERFRQFRRLLGEEDLSDPAEGADVSIADAREDTATHNSQVFRMIAGILAQIPGGAGASSGLDLDGIPVNDYEDFELALSTVSQSFALGASAYDVLSGIANIVPNFNIEPWGIGATFGGSNIGSALSAVASAARGESNAVAFGATLAGKAGQFALRADDWIHQRNLAGRDIMATDREILATEIRRQVAEHERDSQTTQREEEEVYEDALREKFTNDALYTWMVGRLSDLHFRMHQLAHDWALRAERAAQIELHRPQLSHIRFGNWDGLRKGLLAGESLASDIRHLRMAHAEYDLREEEMVKHVSLARLDPEALVRLRETGRAEFSIPEAAFDLDVPGQYLRRIHSVAVTLPCVSGPYTGVHCRMTLLRSTVRTSTGLMGAQRRYGRITDGDDPRFMDRMTPIDSIVTSSARNDTGLFEDDPADQRLRPFEGAGAIGDWRAELPTAMPAFDYGTISDLVLHVRYTARNGGDLVRNAAERELAEALNAVADAAGGTGLMRRISLRHEAPTAWAAFVQQPVGTRNNIALPLDRALLPYFIGDRAVEITGLAVLPRLARDRYGAYRDRLSGSLRPLGEVDANAAVLGFNPWLAPVLRAEWAGVVDIDLRAPGGGDPSPWLLSLWRAMPAEQPLEPDALEDVELVLRHRLA